MTSDQLNCGFMNTERESSVMPHIGTLQVEQESTVVVYDPDTGQIVHTHQSVTMRGGKHPDQQTLERDALVHLSQAQPHITKKSAFLHVHPSTLKQESFYKVDTKNRVLVEIQKI